MNIEEAVDQVRKLEATVAMQEENLNETQRQLDSYKQAIIPDILSDLGVKKMTLTDGTQVRVEPMIHATLTEEAYQWLVSQGHEAIVKTKLEVEDSPQARAFLADNGIEFTPKRSVHHQTLKAFVKEQLEAGAVVPADAFKLHIGATTYIKQK